MIILLKELRARLIAVNSMVDKLIVDFSYALSHRKGRKNKVNVLEDVKLRRKVNLLIAQE